MPVPLSATAITTYSPGWSSASATGGGAELAIRRADAQPAAGGHGVARVHGEIEEGALELARVDEDGPRRRGNPALDGDALAEGALQQLADAAHEGRQEDRLRIQPLLPGEGEELARQRAGALGTAQDGIGEAPELRLPAPRCRVEAPRQRLGAADDDGQEIVEVMGDAGGKLTDRLHFLRLAELLLDGALLRHVARHLGEADQGTALVADGVDDDARPEAAAVLAQAPALEVEPAMLPRRREGARRQAALPVLLAIEEREMAADDLVPRVAQDLRGPGIRVENAAVAVEEEDGVVHDPLHQQPNLALALLEPGHGVLELLGPPRDLGDVLEAAQRPDDGAARIAQGIDVDEAGDPASVRALDEDLLARDGSAGAKRRRDRGRRMGKGCSVGTEEPMGAAIALVPGGLVRRAPPQRDGGRVIGEEAPVAAAEAGGHRQAFDRNRIERQLIVQSRPARQVTRGHGDLLPGRARYLLRLCQAHIPARAWQACGQNSPARSRRQTACWRQTARLSDPVGRSRPPASESDSSLLSASPQEDDPGRRCDNGVRGTMRGGGIAGDPPGQFCHSARPSLGCDPPLFHWRKLQYCDKFLANDKKKCAIAVALINITSRERGGCSLHLADQGSMHPQHSRRTN